MTQECVNTINLSIREYHGQKIAAVEKYISSPPSYESDKA